MEKPYVNEIALDGTVSTVGLFYSRAEAEHIFTQLRAILERDEYHYEIVDAVRHVLSVNGSQRSAQALEEKRS